MVSLVSIILPVYNNKDDVIDAIKSVINQTYRNWELIIIDDASTDGTYQALKCFIAKNKRFNLRLTRNKRNFGVYTSLNKGLKFAKGRYITRIDSDDTFHPRKLEKQIKILDNNPGTIAVDAYYQRQHILAKNNEITVMFRKSVIKKIGFYDTLKFGADSEFNHRIQTVYGRNRIKKIEEVLYFAKIRKNSLSRSDETRQPEVRKKYRQTFLDWHRKGENLYIPFPVKKRPFEVDPIMLKP